MEDLIYLANEYESLLNKRFKYVFENNVSFAFQFQPRNFYHLLGFHKLSDSTVEQMLLNNIFNREDFFKYVKEGRIGLDYIDASVLNGFTDCVVNFNDTHHQSKLNDIKRNRFEYFKASFLQELLLSKIIIDFNPEDCDSDIQAEKLFFKMIEAENRNLNLFIGKNEEQNYFYPATFFLETRKDRYKQNVDTTEQIQLKLLSREIVDLTSNQTVDFYVNWINVFREVASSKEQEVLNTLKHWHGTYISEQYANAEIVALQKEITTDELQKRKLDKIKPNTQDEARDVKKKIRTIAKELKNNKREVEVLRQYLLIVHNLELKSLLKIYQEYFHNALNKDILRKMLSDNNFFNTTLYPNQFIEIYNRYSYN